jgi:hypothetical protein
MAILPPQNSMNIVIYGRKLVTFVICTYSPDLIPPGFADTLTGHLQSLINAM